MGIYSNHNSSSPSVLRLSCPWHLHRFVLLCDVPALVEALKRYAESILLIWPNPVFRQAKFFQTRLAERGESNHIVGRGVAPHGCLLRQRDLRWLSRPLGVGGGAPAAEEVEDVLVQHEDKEAANAGEGEKNVVDVDSKGEEK
jgi:hypothetical protein